MATFSFWVVTDHLISRKNFNLSVRAQNWKSGQLPEECRKCDRVHYSLKLTDSRRKKSWLWHAKSSTQRCSWSTAAEHYFNKPYVLGSKPSMCKHRRDGTLDNVCLCWCSNRVLDKWDKNFQGVFYSERSSCRINDSFYPGPYSKLLQKGLRVAKFGNNVRCAVLAKTHTRWSYSNIKILSDCHPCHKFLIYCTNFVVRVFWPKRHLTLFLGIRSTNQKNIKKYREKNFGPQTLLAVASFRRCEQNEAPHFFIPSCPIFFGL